jgi:hypothetical protein
MSLLNVWIIEGWLFRVVLVAPPSVVLSSRGSLRWRTDTVLEVFWESGSQDGSIVFPVDEAGRFRPRDPGSVAAEYPEFADIGGREAKYSDCLEFRFDFGLLLLLRFDMGMFDP